MNFATLELPSPKCSYCSNPYSIVGQCNNFHCICFDCQKSFPLNCPVCSEPFIPPKSDENLLDLEYLLAPEDVSSKGNTEWDFLGCETSVLEIKHGRKKKSPVEKCKEHFFLAIWDALTGLAFSGYKKTGKGKKTLSIADSISKILSRVTRKMGKSVYDGVVTCYQDKKTIHASLGLFMLLIGGQFVFQKIRNGS